MARKTPFPSDETSRVRALFIKVLHPLCRAVGTLVGIEGEKIDDYFIERNNRVIVATGKKYRPEQVLLVLPHCLQDWECPHRINADIHNCKACGKCSIPKLIEIGDRYKVRMRVVGGGSAARRAVYDNMPSFVIAVACERDMVSGLKDAMPLPIIGILNERPNGPCKNTTVDIARVEQTLAMLIDGK
ncbi:MAG: hypothetical protein Kow0099_34750 [Candidatus Abyssubacteria bacterium]